MCVLSVCALIHARLSVCQYLWCQSVDLSVCVVNLPMCMFVSLCCQHPSVSVCQFVLVNLFLCFICLSIYSVNLSVRVCLSVYSVNLLLCFCLSVFACQSIRASVCQSGPCECVVSLTRYMAILIVLITTQGKVGWGGEEGKVSDSEVAWAGGVSVSSSAGGGVGWMNHE